MISAWLILAAAVSQPAAHVYYVPALTSVSAVRIFNDGAEPVHVDVKVLPGGAVQSLTIDARQAAVLTGAELGAPTDESAMKHEEGPPLTASAAAARMPLPPVAARIESDHPLVVSGSTIGRSSPAIPLSAASPRTRIEAPLSTKCCRASLSVINTTAADAQIDIVVRDLAMKKVIGQAIATLPAHGSGYYEDVVAQLLTKLGVPRGAVEVTAKVPVIALLVIHDTRTGDARTITGQAF